MADLESRRPVLQSEPQATDPEYLAGRADSRCLAQWRSGLSEPGTSV